MGIFDRLRFAGRTPAGDGEHRSATAEQEASRLLEEGMALEEEGRTEEALQRYEDAIERMPTLARAHFNRGNILLDRGDAKAALEAYRKAVEYKPDSAGAHYNLGNACIHLGRYEDAVVAYRQATALKPDFVEAEVALGRALQDLGKLDQAVVSYRRALETKPGEIEVLRHLGDVLTDLGRPGDAAESYRQALAISPADVEMLNNLGAALKELGQLEDAVACYCRALDINPRLVAVHNNLGAALKSLGRIEDAVACYRRALEISPDLAEVHSNLAVALGDLGQLGAAMESFRRALAINPDFAEAHYNLGIALQSQGRFDEALASYRRALDARPDYVEVHNNLGIVLNGLGRLDGAIESFRRALAIDPGYAEAHMNLGATLKDLGCLDEAVASTRRALEVRTDYAMAQGNLIFIQNYLAEESTPQLLAEARRYGDIVARQARPATAWRNHADPARPLRVGLVSPDLHQQHPVGNFLEGVLVALSAQAADRLELFIYTSAICNDKLSARIRACCRGWQAVDRLSDERVAQLIREDGIDILIDLSGHTAHNRLPVFAWKPAPVQITWLGYFATTGVGAIDYLLADPWTLPESEEVQFTERIWRLPETRLCFTPPDVKVDVADLPAFGKGHLTFGCFNHLTKVNDAVVAVWARVLAAVPDSRLFLKAVQLKEASVRQSVVDRFAAHGIDGERLILEGSVPRAEYFAAYHRVDIVLDPFPYPGGTTTVEALWMGVPVLTLAGKRFLSRQGVGLLMNAGLPDWVATDADDYVARAVAHTGDLQRLAALRAGLRQQVLASPIFDAERFAGHFEAALQAMWQRWCEQHAGLGKTAEEKRHGTV